MDLHRLPGVRRILSDDHRNHRPVSRRRRCDQRFNRFNRFKKVHGIAGKDQKQKRQTIPQRPLEYFLSVFFHSQSVNND